MYVNRFGRFAIALAASIEVLCFVGADETQAATLRDWPGVAPPCDTTLQACINGAGNDDTIRVQSNGPIDEKLQIGKPLSVIGAPGYRPVLAAGRTVEVFNSPGAGIDWNFTLDGFGFLAGAVGVRSGSGNAHIILRRLDVYAVAGSYVGGAIGIDNFGNGHLTYEVERNRIRLNDSSGIAAIAVTSPNGGPFEGSVHDNRIESSSSVANTGLQLIGTAAPAPDIRVYSNQISGNFGTGMIVWVADQSNLIFADNAMRSVATSSYGLNLVLTSGGGNALTASLFNNTVAGFGTGLLSETGIGGRISGNVFAYNSNAAISLGGSTMTEDHCLYFSNGGPAPALGPGSMVADPKFRRGIGDMRLTLGSPAIDAADSAALATLLANASLPQIDADGSRRFKGATSLADIGAFEFGDGALIESATAANGGVIDSPLLNGNSAALPQSIQDQTPDTYSAPAFDAGLTALTYAGGRFDVIDESDGGAPATNSAYNIFVPSAGNGAFAHLSQSAGNVFGFTTELGNAYVDNHSERIILVTHRAAPLFDHPFGLAFFSSHWFIEQLDAQNGDPDFPDGINFHIYAQDPSLNAFVWTAPAAAVSTALDHPLLNGEPCGRVYATNGNLNPHPIGVRYDQGRWTIANVDGAQIAAGAQFHVVVDEAATQFCRYDHIFHNGYDG